MPTLTSTDQVLLLADCGEPVVFMKVARGYRSDLDNGSVIDVHISVRNGWQGVEMTKHDIDKLWESCAEDHRDYVERRHKKVDKTLYFVEPYDGQEAFLQGMMLKEEDRHVLY